MQTGVVIKDGGEKKKKKKHYLTNNHISEHVKERLAKWWKTSIPSKKKLKVTSSVTSFPSTCWHATSQTWTKDSAKSFKNASKISSFGIDANFGIVSSPCQYEVTHRTWAEVVVPWGRKAQNVLESQRSPMGMAGSSAPRVHPSTLPLHWVHKAEKKEKKKKATAFQVWYYWHSLKRKSRFLEAPFHS